MTPTLVALPYSPWSRRALQALRVEGIPHRVAPHLIGLGDLGLRLRSGNLTGRVSIPTLLRDDGPAIADSTAIARWASAHGQARLFPDEHEAEILEIVALADRCLAAGRLRATARVLADPVAVAEQVPDGLRVLGPVASALARGVGRGILRKYAALVPEDPDAALEAGLGALAARVHGHVHLVADRLTWADLAAASALGFVAPHDDGSLKPASLRAFSAPELAAAHPGLLAFRAAVEAEVAARTGVR
jgi:glutathione S-transferase